MPAFSKSKSTIPMCSWLALDPETRYWNGCFVPATIGCGCGTRVLVV
ncbi:hypothetical protein JI435_424340 [Parastagonospora nodorum SN15]|uniref:Uncharacterized protein n=1 Tax=Phaeosphaeria nodorum (strain SN15 / ATCC MYA-4574 / FGSC 10173) TaxID=321614 RepID=A0A7U2ID27_PHANO|nr:hypothetical protein JI435_424340 [Parastagonospora nodorum SN15]